jgi:hypothetical protein
MQRTYDIDKIAQPGRLLRDEEDGDDDGVPDEAGEVDNAVLAEHEKGEEGHGDGVEAASKL